MLELPLQAAQPELGNGVSNDISAPAEKRVERLPIEDSKKPYLDSHHNDFQCGLS